MMNNDAFFGAPFSPEAIVFLEAETKVPDVKTEYHIFSKGVKFHFWKDPEFPENFEDILTSALSGYPKDSVLVEYIPEVDSWYAHVVNISVGLSPILVESIVNKILVESGKHGN